jgi:hypothetical protein
MRSSRFGVKGNRALKSTAATNAAAQLACSAASSSMLTPWKLIAFSNCWFNHAQPGREKYRATCASHFGLQSMDDGPVRGLPPAQSLLCLAEGP